MLHMLIVKDKKYAPKIKYLKAAQVLIAQIINPNMRKTMTPTQINANIRVARKLLLDARVENVDLFD